MKPYRYHPLGKDDFTRILQLHPSADRAAPLHCDVKHCREDAFSCEAVSYAWGTPLFTGTLLCDSGDGHIQITPSLDTVLRALRSPSEMRKLWVDAACINQQDSDEKSRQVRAMSKIYRKARQVVAWVGDDHEDGSKVLLFLQRYAKELSLVDHYVIHGASSYKKPEDVEGMDAIASIEKGICEIFGTRGLEALRKFFLRPWFKRRWIIQEVVLAKKASICCGSVSMEFSEFALGAKAMNLFCELQGGGHILDPQSLMDDHIANMISGIAGNHKKKSWKGMTTAGFRHPILGLLHTFHPAKCSDDRDRIYALLGLSDDLAPKFDVGRAHKRRKLTRVEFPVSYEDGIERVYTTLAMKLLDNLIYSGPGQLLHMAGAFRPADSITSDIPDWIPDWRAPRRFLPILNSTFSAGPIAQEDHCWKVSDDKKVLYLTGWRHSIVSKKAGGVCEVSSFEQLKQTIQQWWRFYTDLLEEQNTSTDTDLTLGDHWYNSFFGSVTMGRRAWIGRYDYPPREFVDILFDGVQNAGESIWRAITEPDKASPLAKTRHDESSANDNDAQPLGKQPPRVTETLLQMRSCAKNLTELMKGRSLFKNDKGELMNCPDDAEVGDIVAVFSNMDTPFVIRPSNKASTTRAQERGFCLIGDCYVQGIMKRDLRKGEKLGEPNQFLLV